MLRGLPRANLLFSHYHVVAGFQFVIVIIFKYVHRVAIGYSFNTLLSTFLFLPTKSIFGHYFCFYGIRLYFGFCKPSIAQFFFGEQF